MKNILEKIDKLVCRYLGLDITEITPLYVQKKGKELMVSNTEPFKRHIHTKKLEDFFNSEFNKLNPVNKKKFGMALGKSLAKNLTISFDEINIKE